MQNWAGHHEYAAAKIHYPAGLDEVRSLVAGSGKIKALGTRHSFNDIADSPGDQISLKQMDRILSLDSNAKNPTVTVEAGITYGKLCGELHRAGFALHNLASLPHISVAGACATATHGSGDRNAILAAAVSEFQLVTAGGDVVEFSREKDGERFFGAVVGLGALGVVTQLTLNLLRTFQMRQNVFENLPLEVVKHHFDAVFGSAYSVSLFTDWRTPRINQIWIKRRLGDGDGLEFNPALYEALEASGDLHPLGKLSPENCTDQMGVAGAWHERLPHFRVDFTPSSGEELQAEYLVPRQHAVAALEAVYELREQISPILHISEIRSIAADDFWMSPCYRQPCVGIHFTWKKNWPAVSKVLPMIEATLAPFSARPHWGKLFTMSPKQFQPLYAKLNDFRSLVREFDPAGKFRNTFLDANLF